MKGIELGPFPGPEGQTKVIDDDDDDDDDDDSLVRWCFETLCNTVAMTARHAGTVCNTRRATTHSIDNAPRTPLASNESLKALASQLAGLPLPLEHGKITAAPSKNKRINCSALVNGPPKSTSISRSCSWIIALISSSSKGPTTTTTTTPQHNNHSNNRTKHQQEQC